MGPGRVLLVDDSESILVALSEHLRTTGYEVEAVGTVAEGRKAAALRRPDVLLADLQLDDGTGLDLIRQVRGSFGEQARPGCVLLTGYASMESAIEAVRSGADEYLLKPVDLKELDAVVGALAVRHSLDARHFEPGPAAEALRRIATPLSVLRAHLDMLSEGRYGPLTSAQDDKLAQARDTLRQIADLVRGSGKPRKSSPPRGRVERSELGETLDGIFAAWSADFERRGVQVAWSGAPAGPALRLDLNELKRETEDFLAACLTGAGMGMTLRLAWQPSSEGVHAALTLEAGPGPSAGAAPPGPGSPAPQPLALPAGLRLAMKNAD